LITPFFSTDNDNIEQAYFCAEIEMILIKMKKSDNLTKFLYIDPNSIDKELIFFNNIPRYVTRKGNFFIFKSVVGSQRLD
jgi:hypothetical protein